MTRKIPEQIAKIETIMKQCKHSGTFHMPDSLADVCKDCGKVWIAGEPWDYKSGNIIEWVDDITYGD